MKKISISIVRLIVGVVFIISGFVKLVDPIGFSFKLEEYFEPPVLNMPFFIPYAYPIAIFVVAFELILGVLLLLGFLRKFTLLSLLGLTIFFGFLTFYSAYFNKVTDCGCFGDALKFTPWGSFTKDMVLLFLALILWWGRDYIKPLWSNKVSAALLTLTVVGCIGLVCYTHKHLPIIDFRPYKIGVNIQKNMEIPEDAPKAVYDYHWKFKVGDREETITTQGAYPEVEGGEYLSVETELVSKGYEPPIHDFVIQNQGEDVTAQLLLEPKLLLVTSYDLKRANLAGFVAIKRLTDKALKAGYKVVGLTPSPEQAKRLLGSYGLNFDFYAMDVTPLKTMVRANPAVIRLEAGTIKQKVSYNDTDKIEL
ncbi:MULTISPECIES: BT_3928 family protein [Capnocytophaga]|uniref:BT_3928 family protein n=1 Tax=Capnocytophaga TaxID=1016 RepID=UPI00027C457C|nr:MULTISPECIES: BT_3928 family protein [Capnocytophaga]EJU26379.1 DoxX family protein [Capnocytophaga sp. CM59]